jgi:sterol 3beta-glucosyltransferase
MKILVVSIGTRGDTEPFLAIGQILQEKGHSVVAVLPEQFRSLADEVEIEFESLGREYIDSLGSSLAKEAMGASGSRLNSLLANFRLAGQQWGINRNLVRRQFELVEKHKPDRILYNPNATYPVIWGVGRDEKHILISPVPYLHYVKGHAHVGFNGDFGPIINRLTYSMANFGLTVTLWISTLWLGVARSIDWGRMRQSLRTRKVIYTISPVLYPRSEDWPDSIQVLGFHQRRPNEEWVPSEELLAFLDANQDEKILFVSFGSMANPDPAAKTRAILEILERNKLSAIICTGSGGLIDPGDTDNDRVHFLSQLPYDWIFPQMYAVIHHGGSGTTHMALQHGCATMAVPHIADQFAWDTIIHEMGVGPEGMRINRIELENLESRILELVDNEAFKIRAEQISSQMQGQDYREELCRFITGL